MRELAERIYHGLCLALGQLLRRARYSRTSVVREDGTTQVRKQRALHAPLLVWMSGPLMRVLGTGVRVLPQREWEERERRMYRMLHESDIRVLADGTVIVPCLPGVTLAALLEDPVLHTRARRRAIELAVGALADLHRRELTHGDAMAENVLVDLDEGTARWIDFENEHGPGRPMQWRRSDDMRALLTSCMVRPGRCARADTFRLVLDAYADRDVCRILSTTFDATWRRPLAFHLGQAGASYLGVREIGRLLKERLSERSHVEGGRNVISTAS